MTTAGPAPEAGPALPSGSTPARRASLRTEGARLQVALPTFEGPLDLLLHLIQRDELDVFDIPIAHLTAAYLEALEALEALGLELASEFLVMAATLLQLKSRLLLPTPPAEPALEIEAPDPRAELVTRLLSYQAFREVAAALEARPRLGRDSFLRPSGQDRPEADTEEALARHDVFRLAEAFRRLVSQPRFAPPHEVRVERISLAERIAQIAELLGHSPSALSFAALCHPARHREERVTTFLALLELARLKLVDLEQAEPFGGVAVSARVADIAAEGERAAGRL